MDFWDKVDSRLEMIRSRAEGDQVKGLYGMLLFLLAVFLSESFSVQLRVISRKTKSSMGGITYQCCARRTQSLAARC